jgi:predicted SnoaL-like aldol condensation-catalyzing enzyme
MTGQEQNRQNVLVFYDRMFNHCQPTEAIERYVGDFYIQHNPPWTMPMACQRFRRVYP